MAEGYNGAYTGQQIDEAVGAVRELTGKTTARLFASADWVAGAGECTITFPFLSGGQAGAVVTCQAFALTGGAYRQDVWAARETYATLSAQGEVVLHCAGESGYTGGAVVVVRGLS